MKLEDRASKKVERAGEPNALCQYATKRAHGSSCSVKRIVGEWGGLGGVGTCKNQRSESVALAPWRKGEVDSGESS